MNAHLVDEGVVVALRERIGLAEAHLAELGP